MTNRIQSTQANVETLRQQEEFVGTTRTLLQMIQASGRNATKLLEMIQDMSTMDLLAATGAVAILTQLEPLLMVALLAREPEEVEREQNARQAEITARSANDL